MEVRFVAPDLRRLDKLKLEAISIPFFEDERPLGGPLGLVDWRLCGTISKLILRGRVTGRAGETVLIPARPRLTFEKLFLFGVGPRQEIGDAVFDATVGRILTTLTRAQVRASVLGLPGRAGLVTAERAMERFLAVASKHTEHDEVTLVEDAESQRAMGPIVERERRRARLASTEPPQD